MGCDGACGGAAGVTAAGDTLSLDRRGLDRRRLDWRGRHRSRCGRRRRDRRRDCGLRGLPLRSRHAATEHRFARIVGIRLGIGRTHQRSGRSVVRFLFFRRCRNRSCSGRCCRRRRGRCLLGRLGSRFRRFIRWRIGIRAAKHRALIAGVARRRGSRRVGRSRGSGCGAGRTARDGFEPGQIPSPSRLRRDRREFRPSSRSPTTAVMMPSSSALESTLR